MSQHSSDHTNPSPSEIHENPPETLEEMKRSMVSKAVRGDWSSFVQDYKEKPQHRKAALTQSQQTALHIAIAAGEDEIAMQLIHIVKDEKDIEGGHVLDQKDERGDTALHLAAAMGMTDVCMRIIRVSSQLIINPNEKGETPIFLAASHGWAELFLCFHLKAKKCPANTEDLGYCKREDDNTMLHLAITNNNFGLAFMVLKLYPNLKTSCNSNGDTPLHILATKPTAFRSGKPLDIVENLFYKCISVKTTHYDEYVENLKELEETEMEEDKKAMELKKKFPKLLPGEEISALARALFPVCAGPVI